jgi:hypothetical protein
MSATMQDQQLKQLDFRVGVVKEKTQLDATSFWTDADKIRFRFGRPELMGGWRRAVDVSQDPKIFGVPRLLTSVRNRLGQPAAFIATSNGLFSSELSTFYEITPITASVSASNILSTTAGSTKVIVSVSAHGLVDQTLVGIVSVSTTIGGNVIINPDPATEVLFEVSIISANSFSIDTGTTAAATSISNGGHALLNFRYKAGNISTQQLAGWGTGSWGGNFGWGSPAGTIPSPLRLWSSDLWGTNIMTVPSGGPLMYWDTSAGITDRATIVTAAPSVNQIVRIASEARHVLLYGTHDITGLYSPLLIRWCSQEDFTDWTPSNTNTAGDYPLPSRGSEIRAVHRASGKTAILTDNDIFVQQYIGGNDVFGFTAAGEQCGIIARNAAIEYAGILYWMSNSGQFFQYDGRVQPLGCTVLRFVYDNLEPQYRDKIYATTNATFDEVMWFYTSKDSPNGENDRYVIYNTREKHWTIGTMPRTVWEDSNTFELPLAIDDNAANLYYQESGYTADTSALAANLVGAYFDEADGNQLLFSNKFVPDFSNLSDNTPYLGTLNISLQARRYPGGPVITKGPFAVSGTTQKVSTRLRGRELTIRIQSSTSSDLPWRMGQFRMALELDGQR